MTRRLPEHELTGVNSKLDRRRVRGVEAVTESNTAGRRTRS
jgi:hypothetical protein